MILLMLQHPNGGSSAVPCDDYELTLDSDVRAPVQDFVLRCWSQHEGGFGGLPRSEAHGGMTYCSVASLALLGWWRHNTAQVRSMRRRAIHWCVQRHGCGPVANEETVDDELDHWERVGDGQGFQGRPNKTHDTCYTFWIGCALRILEASEFGMKEDSSLLNDERLSEFVLSCEGPLGGFGRDGQDSDPLHSALGFAGLSCRRGVLGRKLHPVYSTIAQVEGAV
ncbi:Hypothetical protein, putative [Bodo saltans]|uniref:Geranylgeranyl transferase type II subunit beta n=1 Tax=Bodo saltans TaxID=75058 RepID=A0A0S4JB48_BODSA|nr:Hypothetical protein, putative [Bodo saltans]|eukprot:CUG87422.1 Hypothetical protein, putative [Bodo saltans]